MVWESFDRLRMSGGKEVQDERILTVEIATSLVFLAMTEENDGAPRNDV